MYVFLSFLLAFFSFVSELAALADLDLLAQEYVLETKKIEIDKFPEAFNPSIIRWKDKLLMSFRIIPDAAQSFNGEIGLIWLKEDFSPSGQPQLLNLQEGCKEPCRAEDARLIAVGDTLYLVYSNNMEKKISKEGFRLYVAILEQNEKGAFCLSHRECLTQYPGATAAKREKNWVPFAYEGQLLLAYSIVPHIIFLPLLDGMGRCEPFTKSEAAAHWNWGELRGGTPGLLVDGEYLSFFHSSLKMATIHSNGKETPHYFMGAYTYKAEPPFEITAISPEPIFGKNFYNGATYKPYWGAVNVVFPCGYLFNEKFIWVVYGRQDHEIWVVKLNREKLLASLITQTDR